jgi:hypothetical protein
MYIYIYITLVLPLFTYAVESWTVTKNYARKLSVFETKILRRICGPICEKWQWVKRQNRESEDLYIEPHVVNVMKSGRLSWAGHVARMNENELLKKIIHKPWKSRT